MVAATLLILGSAQATLQQQLDQMVKRLDPLPFETVTNDQSKLDRFKRECLDRQGHYLLQYIGSPIYQVVAHPRHAAAYENLSSLVQWKTIEGKNGTITASASIDQLKVSQTLLDEDMNTILNRLLLSHPFLSQEQAMRAYDNLEKHKLLSQKANRFGQTPLMLAAEAGWNRIFDRLLSTKALIELKDQEGRDVIDYLKYSQPQVNQLAFANRDAYTTEAIADSIYRRSSKANKERLFIAINTWLVNPYRSDCGTGMDRLEWPTQKGKRPAPQGTKSEYVIDRPTNRFDPPKSEWDPRKGGG